MSEFGPWLDWMREHEPPLAAAVEERVDDVEDFLRVEDFAYGVKQAYSKDHWSLVGEAGAFADPFYSPGSDFIGFGNTFTTDLIVHDLDGEDISERVDYYNDRYQALFEYVMNRYRDTYPVFGNAGVTFALLGWDFYLNHIGIVLLFVKNKFTDIEFMKSVQPDTDRIAELNARMHQLFRDWNEIEQFDTVRVGVFAVLLEGLTDLVKDFTDEELADKVRDQRTKAEAMAVVLFHQATGTLPDPPPPDRAVNPYALGLDPEKWEADGLYDSPGLTLEEARKISGAIDQIPEAAPPAA
jgi:hypothetical protein